MVLPGAIWQEMLKVDGADMSVSAVYHDPFSTTDIHLNMLNLPVSCCSAIFYSKKASNTERIESITIESLQTVRHCPVCKNICGVFSYSVYLR